MGRYIFIYLFKVSANALIFFIKIIYNLSRGGFMFKKKEKKHFFNVTPDMSEYGTIVNLFQNDYEKTTYEYINVNYGIIGIEKGAFKNLISLKEIIINDSVRVIEAQSFYGCKKLTTVKLPKAITEIPSELFYDCYMLENITLPETVRKIGSNAFSNCKSLKEIKLPSSLRIIGSSAFSGCIELKYLEIPSDVISIGNDIIKDTNIDYVILNNRFNEKLDEILPGYKEVEELEKNMLKVIFK